MKNSSKIGIGCLTILLIGLAFIILPNLFRYKSPPPTSTEPTWTSLPYYWGGDSSDAQVVRIDYVRKEKNGVTCRVTALLAPTHIQLCYKGYGGDKDVVFSNYRDLSDLLKGESKELLLVGGLDVGLKTTKVKFWLEVN